MAVAAPAILVVLGPTASGKSAVALQVAQRMGGEILSVDSMQVYRGMDVGTAKPSRDEQARVRHHLIDVVEPTEDFTVARFVDRASAVIDDARRRNVPLVATGGTPLYYKSLFEGLFEGPSADASIRSQLNEQPLEQLHARLAQVDPSAAARIHANDRKRLVRALEVFELTGRPISSLQTEWLAEAGHRYDAKWFGLMWDKEELNGRINARVRQMLEAGWLGETRALLDRFGSLSKTAAEATGYAELIDHLRGESSLDDAVEQIKIATRQLARRQMKWFRRFTDVQWLPGNQPVDALVDQVLASVA